MRTKIAQVFLGISRESVDRLGRCGLRKLHTPLPTVFWKSGGHLSNTEDQVYNTELFSQPIHGSSTFSLLAEFSAAETNIRCVPSPPVFLSLESKSRGMFRTIFYLLITVLLITVLRSVIGT